MVKRGVKPNAKYVVSMATLRGGALTLLFKEKDMETKSVTYRRMPIGIKDLSNGYSEIVDPVSEIITTMMTHYNDEMDKYIFSQLKTDNNYVHIEKPKMPQVSVENSSSVSINYRIIATKTKDRVFGSEKEIIDLQALRTFLYEYNIDFKNMCMEEVKRAINRREENNENVGND